MPSGLGNEVRGEVPTGLGNEVRGGALWSLG